MTIAFNCSACSSPLKVGDDFVGKKVKCPKCAAVNTVPDGEEEAIQQAPKTMKKGKAELDEGLEEIDEGKGKKAKKGKGKKGKMGLLIGGGLALVALGLFMCVCVVIPGGIYFLFPQWVPSFLGGQPSELKYMPTGTTRISYERVDQSRNSKLGKQIEAEVPSASKGESERYEKTYGISASDIDCILEGGTGGDSVWVVTTKSAVKSTDVLSKMKGDSKQEFEEEKAGSYTMQKPKGGGFAKAFSVVGSKTVVYAHDPKTLKAVLERDKMPDFPEAMQHAMKQASFRKSHVHIAAGSDAVYGGGLKKDAKAEFIVSEIDVDSDFKKKTVVSFKEASDAVDAKKYADEQNLKQKGDLEKKGVGNEVTYSVTVSGSVLTEEVRITGKGMITMMKDQGK